jgi:hypothetical protein
LLPPAPPPPAHAGPATPPSQADLVDSLVRCLMQQAASRDQQAGLGTLGTITSTLFRSMQNWSGNNG